MPTPRTKAVRQALRTPAGKPPTQEALAHVLGVSFATVNRWENGRATPERDHDELLATLASVLERTPPEVVWGALVDSQGSKARLYARLTELSSTSPQSN